MIKVTSTGDFRKTERFLSAMHIGVLRGVLEASGREGVEALRAATPVDSGETAASWSYEVHSTLGSSSIIWTNSHIVGTTPLAILLQYGHGTGTGGYVRGRDYINPAIRPVFDRIAENVWKAVTSA
jgi:hypothetical protein